MCVKVLQRLHSRARWISCGKARARQANRKRRATAVASATGTVSYSAVSYFGFQCVWPETCFFIMRKQPEMNDFDLNLSERRVMASSMEIPVLITGRHGDLWFRGNSLTTYLGYAQPKVALTKILKSRNTKTFAELAPCVVSSQVTCFVDVLKGWLAVQCRLDGLKQQVGCFEYTKTLPGLYRIHWQPRVSPMYRVLSSSCSFP